MKRSVLEKLIREILSEEGAPAASANVTAALSGGKGSPLVPRAFAKPGQKSPGAGIMAKDGYKEVKRPKRPSSKAFATYLHEEGASAYQAPFAFTTEESLYNHDAIKISEKLGMEVVNKPKNSSKKTSKTSLDHKKK